MNQTNQLQLLTKVLTKLSLKYKVFFLLSLLKAILLNGKSGYNKEIENWLEDIEIANDPKLQSKSKEIYNRVMINNS